MSRAKLRQPLAAVPEPAPDYAAMHLEMAARRHLADSYRPRTQEAPAYRPARDWQIASLDRLLADLRGAR
jgi:hypothetical protein